MRRPRIAGTRSAGTFRRPTCSLGHDSPPVRDSTGRWVCPDCFNEHVHRTREGRSKLGVLLPKGVKAGTPDYFKDVYPNRATRRAAR